MRAAQNNNESRGGVPLVVALELYPLAEEVGPGPTEGPRANDGLVPCVPTQKKRIKNVTKT